MEVEVVFLGLQLGALDAEQPEWSRHEQGVVALQLECAHAVHKAVAQVVGLPQDLAQDVQVVFGNGGVLAVFQQVYVHFEGLVEDGEQSGARGLRLRIGQSSQLLDLRANGEAEEALEVHVEDPDVAGGQHDEDALVDLQAEADRPDVDPHRGDFLQDLLVAREQQHDVGVLVVHADAVAEDVDRSLHDEVAVFAVAGQEDVVGDLLGLLHQLVGGRRKPVEVLLQEEDVPVAAAAQQRVLPLDGELVLDLDVADGAAALHLELVGLHHELGALGDVQQLQLLRLEYHVPVVHANVLLLPHQLPVADVLVVYVVHEHFVALLRVYPLRALGVFGGALEVRARVEGVGLAHQEVHLLLDCLDLLVQLAQAQLGVEDRHVDFLQVNGHFGGHLVSLQALLEREATGEGPPHKSNECILLAGPGHREVEQQEPFRAQCHIRGSETDVADFTEEAGHEIQQVNLDFKGLLLKLGLLQGLVAPNLQHQLGAEGVVAAVVLELVVDMEAQHLVQLEQVGDVGLQPTLFFERLIDTYHFLAHPHLEAGPPAILHAGELLQLQQIFLLLLVPALVGLVDFDEAAAALVGGFLLCPGCART